MPGLVETHLRLYRERCEPPASALSPPPASASALSPALTPGPTPAPVVAPGEDPLLTGYQDCAAEAVRFLVEEEGRAPDDPTVVGLTEHLQARSAYLEYLSLLRRLESDMEDQLERVLRSAPEHRHQEVEHEAELVLSERHRQLVEHVFRGCDLVLQGGVGGSGGAQDVLPPSPPQTPPQSPPPQSPEARESEHPSRRHFHNNEYLDQVLNWAYSSSPEL